MRKCWMRDGAHRSSTAAMPFNSALSRRRSVILASKSCCLRCAACFWSRSDSVLGRSFLFAILFNHDLVFSSALFVSELVPQVDRSKICEVISDALLFCPRPAFCPPPGLPVLRRQEWDSENESPVLSRWRQSVPTRRPVSSQRGHRLCSG